MLRAHADDGRAAIAGCDNSLPGMMMSLARAKLPGVCLYGGTIMPGKFHDKDVTVQNVFEGVGTHSAGNMTDEELNELEHVACPAAGSCAGMFTANTMAAVSEGLGIALPVSASVPALHPDRPAVCQRRDEAGRADERAPKRGHRGAALQRSSHGLPLAVGRPGGGPVAGSAARDRVAVARHQAADGQLVFCGARHGHGQGHRR